MARSSKRWRRSSEITDRLLTTGSDRRQLANTANRQTTAQFRQSTAAGLGSHSCSGRRQPRYCVGDEALVRYGAVLAPARLSFPLAAKLIGTPAINGTGYPFESGTPTRVPQLF
jgi:hypothetical protein